MAKRRITATNCGDTKSTFWILEGSDVIWMIAGLGSGLLVFRLVHGRMAMVSHRGWPCSPAPGWAGNGLRAWSEARKAS